MPETLLLELPYILQLRSPGIRSLQALDEDHIFHKLVHGERYAPIFLHHSQQVHDI